MSKGKWKAKAKETSRYASPQRARSVDGAYAATQPPRSRSVKDEHRTPPRTASMAPQIRARGLWSPTPIGNEPPIIRRPENVSLIPEWGSAPPTPTLERKTSSRRRATRREARQQYDGAEASEDDDNGRERGRKQRARSEDGNLHAPGHTPWPPGTGTGNIPLPHPPIGTRANMSPVPEDNLQLIPFQEAQTAPPQNLTLADSGA
jgi:hypothetical protein